MCDFYCFLESFHRKGFRFFKTFHTTVYSFPISTRSPAHETRSEVHEKYNFPYPVPGSVNKAFRLRTASGKDA